MSVTKTDHVLNIEQVGATATNIPSSICMTPPQSPKLPHTSQLWADVFDAEMGTSFIQFKGRGFWALDGHLIEFAQKALELGLPDWFPPEIGDYYVGLSEDLVGIGCISLWLDELLTTDERISAFESLIARMELPSRNERAFRVYLSKLINGELGETAGSETYYWTA